MQIIKDNEIFDLKPDCLIEIQNTSPLFSKKGSMSVPVQFPPTAKNQRLIGFPGRSDRAGKIKEKERVAVIDGAIVRYGIINVISGEIEANIGFDEGEAYAKMSKLKLSDIEPLPVYSPGGDNPVTTVVNHLAAVMKGEIEADYFVFPAVTTLEENSETGQVEYYMALNQVGNINGTTTLEGSVVRTMHIKIGSDYADIKMPEGYGISPFIKLHRLLELIWNYLGFKLVENPFRDHPILRYLCILNNTFDTITTGKIEYKHLMPDCTIEDIMEMIWCRFGARYFVNSNTREVRIKFIKDILSSRDTLELTTLKSTHPQIAVSSPKQLKFSAGKSGEKTKTDKDTYDEFLEKCNYIMNPLNHSWINSTAYPINKYNYVMDQVTGEYYYRSPYGNKLNLMSSSFFAWDRKEDLEYEEINSPDEQVPIVADVVPNCPAPFLDSGEYHVNTGLRLNKELEEKQDKKCGLSICYSMGFTGTTGYYFGSIFGFLADGGERRVVYDDEGEEQMFDIDLIYHGNTGLVYHFWQEYIDFMHHANQQTTQSFYLSKRLLSTIDFSRKLSVDGQYFLPESFNQVVGKETSKTTELKLRSLKLLLPYDLEKEHQVPFASPQIYYWKTDNNIAVVKAAVEWEYTNNYYLSWCEKIEIMTPVEESDFAYLKPPTQEDYENNVMYSNDNFMMSMHMYYYLSESDVNLGRPRHLEEVRYFSAWVTARYI